MKKETLFHISFPRPQQRLPHRYTVRGHLWTRDQLLVQVFVLSNDGLWYPQRDVKRSGPVWQVSTCFGFSDAPEGFGYELVALAGAPKVTAAAIPELPVAQLTSQRVKVFRR